MYELFQSVTALPEGDIDFDSEADAIAYALDEHRHTLLFVADMSDGGNFVAIVYGGQVWLPSFVDEVNA